jgi:hypothetical protein
MTYYLPRALRGGSDSNRDGSVTLAEVAAYVSQKVTWAAKIQFSSNERPLITPPLKQTDPSSGLVLSKLTANRGDTLSHHPLSHPEDIFCQSSVAHSHCPSFLHNDGLPPTAQGTSTEYPA